MSRCRSATTFTRKITDKVRDSLDEHQILQTTVEELGQIPGVYCYPVLAHSLGRALSRA